MPGHVSRAHEWDPPFTIGACVRTPSMEGPAVWERLDQATSPRQRFVGNARVTPATVMAQWWRGARALLLRGGEAVARERGAADVGREVIAEGFGGVRIGGTVQDHSRLIDRRG